MTEDSAPYDLPARRLLSVAVKDVKVKKEPALRITVTWEQQREDGEWDKFRFASTQEPRHTFWPAMSSVTPHALSVLNLGADYVDNAMAVSVKLSYDDDDHMIASAKVRKLTIAGEGFLETPAVAKDGDYESFLAPDYAEVLEDLQKEALAFANGVTWEMA